MNFQEFISKLPKSIEFKNAYHYLKIEFYCDKRCRIYFGNLFSVDVLYDGDLTESYNIMKENLSKYKQNNIPYKKYALDGSELGIVFQKILSDNPDINNLSTNRILNLTDEELCLLFERYNVTRTGDKKADCFKLFSNIVEN